MIKANELRIGNLIELPCFNGTGENIVADVNYGIFTCDVNCIRDAVNYGDNWAARPILLTEGWLLKLGFTHWLSNNKKFSKTQMFGDFLIKKADGWVLYDYEQNDVLNYPMLYVHQLQNLYYSLTGDELTVI